MTPNQIQQKKTTKKTWLWKGPELETTGNQTNILIITSVNFFQGFFFFCFMLERWNATSSFIMIQTRPRYRCVGSSVVIDLF